MISMTLLLLFSRAQGKARHGTREMHVSLLEHGNVSAISRIARGVEYYIIYKYSI